MKRIAVLLLPLLMLGLLSTAKEKDEEPLKVLFITGPDSHLQKDDPHRGKPSSVFHH